MKTSESRKISTWRSWERGRVLSDSGAKNKTGLNIIRYIFPIILISIGLSSLSFSETMDDLVKKEGLYYKKFSDVPFHGEIQGQNYGSFKDGLKDGSWVYRDENGRLRQKGTYKNGKKDGRWESYYSNGQLFYKGEFKNGNKVGLWESYYDSQKIFYKGEYIAGKEEGFWIGFNPDGTVWAYRTGMFRNGVKISD